MMWASIVSAAMKETAGNMRKTASVAQLRLMRAQGKIARGEAEVAARQQEALSVQREADRKQQLAEALASQNARAGSAGVAAFEGSPLTIMQEDERREEQATERDVFQTKLAALTLRARGKLAERQAKTAANIMMLNQGASELSKASETFGSIGSMGGGSFGGGGAS